MNTTKHLGTFSLRARDAHTLARDKHTGQISRAIKRLNPKHYTGARAYKLSRHKHTGQIWRAIRRLWHPPKPRVCQFLLHVICMNTAREDADSASPV